MKFFKNRNVDKASQEVKDDNWEETSIPVYFGGEEIGRILKMVGKEVAGLDMLNIWIMTNKGAAIESRIIEIIKKEGIYLGKPLENKDDT